MRVKRPKTNNRFLPLLLIIAQKVRIGSFTKLAPLLVSFIVAPRGRGMRITTRGSTAAAFNGPGAHRRQGRSRGRNSAGFSKACPLTSPGRSGRAAAADSSEIVQNAEIFPAFPRPDSPNHTKANDAHLAPPVAGWGGGDADAVFISPSGRRSSSARAERRILYTK